MELALSTVFSLPPPSPVWDVPLDYSTGHSTLYVVVLGTPPLLGFASLLPLSLASMFGVPGYGAIPFSEK